MSTPLEILNAIHQHAPFEREHVLPTSEHPITWGCDSFDDYEAEGGEEK